LGLIRFLSKKLFELRNDPAPEGLHISNLQSFAHVFSSSSSAEKEAKRPACLPARQVAISRLVVLLNFGIPPNNYLKVVWLPDSPLIFAFLQTSDIRFQTLEPKAKKGAHPHSLPTVSRSALRGARYGNILRQSILLICKTAWVGGLPAYGR